MPLTRLARIVVSGVVGSLVGLAAIAVMAQERSLRADLGVAAELENGGSVTVNFTLVNTSNQAVRVLKWNTPLEGIRGRLFRVQRDGQTVAYEGILVKRGDPTSDDYEEIPAGGSVENKVDLAPVYDFSAAGAYSIQYLSPPASEVVAAGAAPKAKRGMLRRVEIPSSPVTVRIKTAIAPRARLAKAAPRAKQTVINNCTEARKAVVQAADALATTKTTTVSSGVTNDSLYGEWFGIHSSSRFSRVQDNFKKTNGAFVREEITYNCGGPECRPNYIAYVWTGPPNEVFLCDAFFPMPPAGIDSQYGTLIHELTHEKANTDDWAYGEPACKALALNDPDKAVENADSHQFYAEYFSSTPVGAPKAVYGALLVILVMVFYGARRRGALSRPRMT